VIWHGGGGFIHLVVGPSMYEVDEEDGDVFLSAEATNGAWSQSVAAQLKFALTPIHPVFCGVRGRQRLAVIDGVADEVVVRTVFEHLGERERERCGGREGGTPRGGVSIGGVVAGLANKEGTSGPVPEEDGEMTWR